MSTDLQRLDELPDSGAVAWKICGCHTQRRRPGRSASAQSLDKWRDVAAAGAVEIHGDAVVDDRGEIAARDAHRAEDQAAKPGEGGGILVVNRYANDGERDSVIVRGTLAECRGETPAVEELAGRSEAGLCEAFVFVHRDRRTTQMSATQGRRETLQ
jgi:hypothetical protein